MEPHVQKERFDLNLKQPDEIITTGSAQPKTCTCPKCCHIGICNISFFFLSHC